MKAKQQFTYNETQEEYVIKLKKKTYWWLLFFLLLLLPLILLIRFQKDIVFRTIDVATETNLSDADVIFSYNDRNLIDLKTFNLFSNEPIKLEGKTGDDGIVVFENVSYSLYSKLFHKAIYQK